MRKKFLEGIDESHPLHQLQSSLIPTHHFFPDKIVIGHRFEENDVQIFYKETGFAILIPQYEFDEEDTEKYVVDVTIQIPCKSYNQ